MVAIVLCAGLALGLVLLIALHVRLTSLRDALLSSGAIEHRARLPPDPLLPEPLPRPAPPPAGWVDASDAPSTKPVRSRTVPAPLRSEPVPVPLEDAVQRAMKRIERHARVTPEVAARWEQRLRALGAGLGLPADAEPTDSQLARVVRELYEAEADVKDAGRAPPPPLEATLASAVSPIAVRIAEALTKPDDADGEATLRHDGDRPATLPRPNADDDPGDGRDTGEEMTKVFTKQPGEADAQIPSVAVRPATVRPPHRPPRPIADPLAGVPIERPTSSATRTAEAFRSRTTRSGGVCAAPGNERDKGTEP